MRFSWLLLLHPLYLKFGSPTSSPGRLALHQERWRNPSDKRPIRIAWMTILLFHIRDWKHKCPRGVVLCRAFASVPCRHCGALLTDLSTTTLKARALRNLGLHLLQDSILRSWTTALCTGSAPKEARDKVITEFRIVSLKERDGIPTST